MLSNEPTLVRRGQNVNGKSKYTFYLWEQNAESHCHLPFLLKCPWGRRPLCLPPQGTCNEDLSPKPPFPVVQIGLCFHLTPETWSRSWNSWFAQAMRKPRCVVLCYIKRNVSFTWILLLPPVAQSVWAPIAKYQGSGTLATGTYFLTILKVYSVRSMCLQGWCLLRPLSWAWRWPSSPPVFTWSFLCVYLNLSLFLLIRTHLFLLSYL